MTRFDAMERAFHYKRARRTLNWTSRSGKTMKTGYPDAKVSARDHTRNNHHHEILLFLGTFIIGSLGIERGISRYIRDAICRAITASDCPTRTFWTIHILWDFAV
jgi:hypothetical protein